MPEKGARRHISGQVNLNEASEQELARVSDVGSERAQKIVQYRNQHGRFESVDELEKVPGFARTLVEDLRQSLTV